MFLDTTDSEKGEDDEWETQQIRKGVTGAQVCLQFILLFIYIYAN